MCPPNLRKISRFGGGVLSRHWNIFKYHNLPSFPEEVPNYWDRNREGGNQHDCNSANQFLYLSFRKCVCCLYLLTIYPSKCRIQISHVYITNLCLVLNWFWFQWSSLSDQFSSQQDWLQATSQGLKLGQVWPTCGSGWVKGSKENHNFNMQVMKHHWRSATALQDWFLEFSGLVPTNAQETKISKISLNWLTQWYPTPISPTCHGDQCCDKQDQWDLDCILESSETRMS